MCEILMSMMSRNTQRQRLLCSTQPKSLLVSPGAGIALDENFAILHANAPPTHHDLALYAGPHWVYPVSTPLSENIIHDQSCSH